MYASILLLIESGNRLELCRLLDSLTPDETRRLFLTEEIKEYILNKLNINDSMTRGVFNLLYPMALNKVFNDKVKTNREIVSIFYNMTVKIKDTLELFMFESDKDLPGENK